MYKLCFEIMIPMIPLLDMGFDLASSIIEERLLVKILTERGFAIGQKVRTGAMPKWICDGP